MLIITGKKTITATTVIFDSGLVIPNHWLVIGARAMIGAALTATAKGSNPARSSPPAGRRQSGHDAENGADDEPAQRLAQGEQRRRDNDVQLGGERGGDDARPGRMKPSISNTTTRASQAISPRTNSATAGSQRPSRPVLGRTLGTVC